MKYYLSFFLLIFFSDCDRNLDPVGFGGQLFDSSVEMDTLTVPFQITDSYLHSVSTGMKSEYLIGEELGVVEKSSLIFSIQDTFQLDTTFSEENVYFEFLMESTVQSGFLLYAIEEDIEWADTTLFSKFADVEKSAISDSLFVSKLDSSKFGIRFLVNEIAEYSDDTLTFQHTRFILEPTQSDSLILIDMSPAPTVNFQNSDTSFVLQNITNHGVIYSGQNQYSDDELVLFEGEMNRRFIINANPEDFADSIPFYESDIVYGVLSLDLDSLMNNYAEDMNLVFYRLDEESKILGSGLTFYNESIDELELRFQFHHPKYPILQGWVMGEYENFGLELRSGSEGRGLGAVSINPSSLELKIILARLK